MLKLVKICELASTLNNSIALLNTSIERSVTIRLSVYMELLSLCYKQKYERVLGPFWIWWDGLGAGSRCLFAQQSAHHGNVAIPARWNRLRHRQRKTHIVPYWRMVSSLFKIHYWGRISNRWTTLLSTSHQLVAYSFAKLISSTTRLVKCLISTNLGSNLLGYSTNSRVLL